MGTGRQAKTTAKKTYRKAMRMPKRKLAKKYSNTVGQIVRRKPGRKTAPSRGYKRRGRRRRY